MQVVGQSPTGHTEGLYKDLEALLLNQIKARPGDAKRRLKLLELYYEGRQREPFLDLAREIHGLDAVQNRSEIWSSVARMGRELFPGEALFYKLDEDPSEPAGQKMCIGERLGDSTQYSRYFDTLARGYGLLQRADNFTHHLDRVIEDELRRPTGLVPLSPAAGTAVGASIYLKREDTGTSLMRLKIAVIGQALLAKKLGKSTLVMPSRSGHSAVIAAMLVQEMGLNLLVYVSETDIRDHPHNLHCLGHLGAKWVKVNLATSASEDLRVPALEHCLHDPDTFLLMGLDGAPHPYPQIVMQSEAVIGREVFRQLEALEVALPSLLVASQQHCATALGFFAPFLQQQNTQLAFLKDAGNAQLSHLDASSNERIQRYAQLHERHTQGQKAKLDRVMEGLEYPSLRREQAWLKESHRLIYPDVAEEQVWQAIAEFPEELGFLPDLASMRALAYGLHQAGTMQSHETVVVLITESMDTRA